MKKHFQVLVDFFLLLFIESCSLKNDVSQPIQTATPIQDKTYAYLAI